MILNPTLNNKSAEVCEVRQMCVPENNDDCGAEQVHVRVRICARQWALFGLDRVDRMVNEMI